MQNLKAPYSNATVTTTTKTIIKTLFRKGLMNMAPEHENDEKRFKENYCLRLLIRTDELAQF